MREVNFWWVLIHLVFLSWEDIRERQLSMAVILELGLSGLVPVLWQGHKPGFLLGFFLLLIGVLTQEGIGYGDGYLMLALGMWLSFEELWKLLLTGVGVLSLYGVCTRKKELPLVPFLTIGYLIGVWR